MILPQFGRFVVRRLEGHSHLVGILHFGLGFSPVEGASYVAVVASRTMIILPEKLDEGIPAELAGQGIDAMLRGKCWRRTEVKATLSVRFISACPESNGWVVFGVANQPLLPAGLYARDGHSWNDVLEGDCRVIPSPAPGSEYGRTCGQMLSDLVVWPTAARRPIALPVVESSLRDAHQRYSALLARHGSSNITQQALAAAIAADPDIARIATPVDTSYCRDLAARQAVGAPHRASAHESRLWDESRSATATAIATAKASGSNHTAA